MGEAYPELKNPRIAQVIEDEERRFFQTISKGMEILEEGPLPRPKTAVLDGEVVFKLHDTYGFPADLTGDVCRERGLKIDLQGFEDAMERQRAAARASAKFKMAAGLTYEGPATTFTGYDTLKEEGAKVLAVYVGGEEKGEAQAGEDCVVVFDKTPFYAESGGQVGDTGECRNDTSLLCVLDTFKVKADVFGQHCHVAEGSVKTGDVFTLSVNEDAAAPSCATTRSRT